MGPLRDTYIDFHPGEKKASPLYLVVPIIERPRTGKRDTRKEGTAGGARSSRELTLHIGEDRQRTDPRAGWQSNLPRGDQFPSGLLGLICVPNELNQ